MHKIKHLQRLTQNIIVLLKITAFAFRLKMPNFTVKYTECIRCPLPKTINKIQKVKEEKKSKGEKINYYAKYSAMAFQMAAIIALGVWGGTSLDKYYSNKFPLFSIVLSLFSVIGAIYWVIKDFIKKK